MSLKPTENLVDLILKKKKANWKFARGSIKKNSELVCKYYDVSLFDLK